MSNPRNTTKAGLIIFDEDDVPIGALWEVNRREYESDMPREICAVSFHKQNYGKFGVPQTARNWIAEEGRKGRKG